MTSESAIVPDARLFVVSPAISPCVCYIAVAGIGAPGTANTCIAIGMEIALHWCIPEDDCAALFILGHVTAFARPTGSSFRKLCTPPSAQQRPSFGILHWLRCPLVRPPLATKSSGGQQHVDKYGLGLRGFYTKHQLESNLRKPPPSTLRDPSFASMPSDTDSPHRCNP
jgi:hypothetical protein